MSRALRGKGGRLLALAALAALLAPMSIATSPASGGDTWDGPAPALGPSLQLSDDLLRIVDGPKLDQAVAIAALAAGWQAQELGGTLPAAAPAPRHDGPADAALALALRHPAALDANGLTALRALDALAEPARSSLAQVLDAFLALEDARDAAFAGVDLAAAGNLAEVGPGLGPLLAARQAFLEASAAFARGWSPAAAASAGPGVQLCPALAMDLVGDATTYDLQCAFILDVGGDDLYLNNAGGARTGAAALLDLAGNDTYAPLGSFRLGRNGGGYLGGVGFLLDRAGNDLYDAGDDGGKGTNGGGSEAGLGMLIDEGGDDIYVSGVYSPSAGGGGRGGANGGGSAGAGFLLDQAGDDTYTASWSGSPGVNGGASSGVGFLFDQEGDDAYSAAPHKSNTLGGTAGANGGGFYGVGFLLDRAGNDTYSAGDDGTNGGAYGGGKGFLRDEGGDDAYVGGAFSTNGGAELGGSGLLLDAAGNDSYTAFHDPAYGSAAVNGGGDLGVGALIDLGGTDAYEDGTGGTGTDRTVVPKGTAGAQVDQSPCPPGSVDAPPACPVVGECDDGSVGVTVDGQGPCVPSPAPDLDGDGVPDAQEPFLCANENPNLLSEGHCDGDDYVPPTIEDIVSDVLWLVTGERP